MSRSCACATLLSRAVTDAGFRLLPPLVRLVWLELVAFAAVAPTPGHLRFLRPVSASVSVLLHLAETETETAVQTLADLALIEPEADGKGLWLAGAKVRAARSEAARANGLRGGRPRKDGTPNASAQRLQTNLLLPTTGGRAETQETQAGKTRVDDDSSSPTKTPSSSSPETARVAEALALAEELGGQAGIDHTRNTFGAQADTRTVLGWLKAGASPALLREVVAEVAPRAKQRIATLAYFAGPVDAALHSAAPSTPSAAPSMVVLWNRHREEMVAACKPFLRFEAFCAAHEGSRRDAA